MFHNLLLLIFLNLPYISSYDFDLVKRNYKCDKKSCNFDHPLITSKTIDKWPQNCLEICGILTLNQDSDVSFDKLNSSFAGIYYLYGGIHIENTTLKSLPAFPDWMTVDCKIIGITIKNNSLLEDISSIMSLMYYDGCFFELSDNKRLDASLLCSGDNWQYRTNWHVSGNKVDCGEAEKFIIHLYHSSLSLINIPGCGGGELTPSNLHQFKNLASDCEIINNHLIITDFKAHNPLPAFPRAKKLRGFLEVKDSSFENLSFLGNLESVISDNHFITSLDIHDNPKMTRLQMTSLKNLTSTIEYPFTVNLQNLHPDFCITLEEMTVFLEFNVLFVNAEAKYCQNLTRQSSTPKLCIFENMHNLDIDCEHIFGDVLIDSGDEKYVEKLGNVTMVFGSITVQNTKLESAGFLRNLRKVANLNDSIPTMQFLSNKHLQHLSLPNIQSFVSRGTQKIVFKSNHDNIFEHPRFCMILQYRSKTKVSYNGRSCKTIKPSNSVANSNFDFDQIDYESFNLSWYYDFDDGFYSTDLTNPQEYLRKLTRLSSFLIFPAFLISIFHLIVLSEKSLRKNHIFVLVIGICICDLIITSILILEYFFGVIWTYKTSICTEDNLLVTLIKLIRDPIKESAQRSASLISILMITLQLITSVLPINGVIINMIKPLRIVLLITVISVINVTWDFSYLFHCSIQSVNPKTCPSFDNSYHFYYIQCGSEAFSENLTPKITDFYYQINGFLTLITGISQLFSIFGLIFQLRNIKNRRNSVTDKSSEDPSKLIIYIGISFLVYQLISGSIFLIHKFVWKSSQKMQDFKDQLFVITWSISIITSISHFLICLICSEKYSNQAKLILWRGKC